MGHMGWWLSPQLASLQCRYADMLVCLHTDVKNRDVLMPVKDDKAAVQKANVHVNSIPVLYGEYCNMSATGCGTMFSPESTCFGFAGATLCATTCARNQGNLLQLPACRMYSASLLTKLPAHCAIVKRSGSMLP